jgi:hypothetical protein
VYNDELGESWCIEYDLIEEGYRLGSEFRGIDVGQEVVQVFGDPFEYRI